jgi:hypothetical protein
MKLKSLLFGSAAVLAAGTGAQAADLPTVEPVEYVRICDAFGTGFFYIPGTDTCLKLSGYVRHESHFVEGFDEGDLSNRYGLNIVTPGGFLIHRDRLVNNWSTRTRGHVEWDARTQTDVGLIRAFIAIEGTRGPSPVTVDEINVPDPTYGSGVTLASAFIQVSNDFGTYTAGKFGSFFDFFGAHLYGTRVGLEDGTTDPNLFAWTFAGGNGFSFSIAAEDPKSTGRRKSKGVFDDYEGQEFPDGVANIRVDQGWGSAQLMGAIKHLHDKTGFLIDGGEDQDGIGWAVGAGVKLGIPGGWEIVGQGGYAQGAVGYIWSDLRGFGDFRGPGADDSQNLAWGGRGGIAGPIGNLKVWADGAFYHEELDEPILGTDGLDFIAAGVGASYSPAPGLTIGPEVAWNRQEYDGGRLGEIGDYDIWGVMWRIQRNF